MKLTKRLTICAAATIILVAALALIPTSLAHANSALQRYVGVDAMGAIMRGENPIVVEHEQLTFDLFSFPTVGTQDGYDGKVTAEYTFYNPSEYTITATLLFPFGTLPYYYDLGADDAQVIDSYALTVDGNAVDTRLRHTLSVYKYGNFDTTQQLALIRDDYVTDSFFSPDLTVTRYDFAYGGATQVDLNGTLCAAFDFINSADRRIVFPGAPNLYIRGAVTRAGIWVDLDDTLTVYVLGTPYAQFPDWKFYKNGSLRDEEQCSLEVALTSTSTLTFEQFVMASRNENGSVTKVDLYNAAVAELSDEYDNGIVITTADFGSGFERSLMRWYEYDITLSPNERVLNSVTAPIYPYIYADYDPPKYDYTYLLSPATTWNSFGDIDILIRTDSLLLDSAPEGFTKTEDGYALSLNGLPDGELTFTLCASEDPERSSSGGPTVLYIVLIATALILLIAAVAGGIIAAIVIACLHARKKI